ncbi:guanylate cyclase [Vibrio cholerae]|nr:guanylate cyclase [Vibrio cholerae]
MVIEKFGVLFWDQMLEDLKPSSEGCTPLVSNTTTMSYWPWWVICVKAQIPAPDLVRAYGDYLFTHLFNSLPENYPHKRNLKTFLLSVDKVIHKELQRLYPNAYLPQFENRVEEKTLTMSYYSKRQLCAAAEGLILGAANQFNQPVKLLSPSACIAGLTTVIVVEFLPS